MTPKSSKPSPDLENSGFEVRQLLPVQSWYYGCTGHAWGRVGGISRNRETMGPWGILLRIGQGKFCQAPTLLRLRRVQVSCLEAQGKFSL